MNKTFPRFLSPVVLGGADVLDSVFRKMQEDFSRLSNYGTTNECFLTSSKGDSIPFYDVVKFSDRIEIRFALPGIDKSAIDAVIGSKGVKLRVQNEEAENPGDYVLKGIKDLNSFELNLEWSFDVDDSKACADYVNGMLLIRLPKKEQNVEKGRRLQID